MLWACDCQELKPSFTILNKRITKFISKSSFSSAFVYLKEVVRITIKVSGGDKCNIGKVLVQCDSHGLPTIIPWLLRKELLDFQSSGSKSLHDITYWGYGEKKLVRSKNQRIIIAILSCLCIYRVFKVNVKPSLKTIVKPFNGLMVTLNPLLLSQAVNACVHPSLGRFIKLKPIKLLMLETASPNSKKSSWGAVNDAIAFAQHPISLKHFVKLNWSYGESQFWLSIWLIFLLALAFPIFLCLQLIRLYDFMIYYKEYPKDKYQMAQLGVVYDQAGKARIVGISNYWVQCLLKPIHDALFSILKKIPEDGTFNQEGPLKALLGRVAKDQMLYSFDLSAATDRLPITLQKDIMNLLIPDTGFLWANLLADMNYAWKKEDKSIKHVRYAVGQPMGAYSSWPMLALTHHVIVKYAAIKAEIKYDFRNYAVLGDDIVIAEDNVAREYLKIMTDLGIEINLTKSLQSNLFCEFAKRWVGPTVDITPIGPGLILNACRNKFAIAALITKIQDMNIINNIFSMSSALNRLPNSFINDKGTEWNAFWASYSLNSLLPSQLDEPSLEDALNWCFGVKEELKPVTLNRLLVSMIQVGSNKRLRDMKQLEDTLKFIIFNSYKVNVAKLSWFAKVYESLLKFLSPGFWVYIISLINEIRRLEILKEKDLILPILGTRIVKTTRGNETINKEEISYATGKIGLYEYIKSETSPLSNSIEFLKSRKTLKAELEIGKEVREEFYKEYPTDKMKIWEVPNDLLKLYTLRRFRFVPAGFHPFGAFPISLRNAIIVAHSIQLPSSDNMNIDTESWSVEELMEGDDFGI